MMIWSIKGTLGEHPVKRTLIYLIRQRRQQEESRRYSMNQRLCLVMHNICWSKSIHQIRLPIILITGRTSRPSIIRKGSQRLNLSGITKEKRRHNLIGISTQRLEVIGTRELSVEIFRRENPKMRTIPNLQALCLHLNILIRHLKIKSRKRIKLCSLNSRILSLRSTFILKLIGLKNKGKIRKRNSKILNPTDKIWKIF